MKMSGKELEYINRDSLQGFLVGDEKVVIGKLGRFQREGKGKTHLLFDFDRTLTVNNNKGEDITTWHILRSHFTPQAQRQYDDLFQRFRPLEIQQKLTQNDAIAWWEQTLSLIKDSQVNMQKVEQNFLSKANARPYATEVFETCEQLGVPTVILSAGVKDVITLWCSYYKINPTVILSTQLKLGEGGLVIGWEKNSLIHVLNKREKGHADLSRIQVTHPLTILVGDSVHDADMVEGEEDVIRIRVIDPREDENISHKRFAEETFQRFDLMIGNGSMKGLLDLVRAINN